jgi:NAD(P)-dependent dehydrogenase (short-subunit alcohol dehydrogenase family)
MDPTEQVALVTGGGVRVGRAIALGLAGAGAHVVVHYNSSAGPAEETAAEARRLGVKAITVRADLTDPLSARTVAATALDRFGRVDILVHAASPFVRGSLFDVDLGPWRQLMGVLVESFLVLMQEAAPGMVERGRGAVVALLDRGVFDPWPEFLAHGVGKTALWALVRSLAVELAPQVRVNAVVPGPVLAPAGMTEERRAQLASQTLMRRWGTPQDVVDAVLFLIRSDYITGEALLVDGGEQWAHCRPTQVRRSGRHVSD